MVCLTLIFPSQKLNSNGTLQRDAREFNPAFFSIPSISVVQFKVQMSKLNGIGKTHQERIFVVELKLKLVRVCSFVCCNGVCKSGLSFTKTKFERHTLTRHKGI